MGSDGECKHKTKIVSHAGEAATDKDQAAGTVEHRSTSSDVLQIPVHVAESDVLGGARQILTKLRPTWRSEDIQFKVGWCETRCLSTHHSTRVVHTLTDMNTHVWIRLFILMFSCSAYRRSRAHFRMMMMREVVTCAILFVWRLTLIFVCIVIATIINLKPWKTHHTIWMEYLLYTILSVSELVIDD